MKRLVVFVIASLFAISGIFAQMSISNAEAMFIFSFTRNIDFGAKTTEFNIYLIAPYEYYNDITSYTNNKTVGQRKINVIRVKSAAEINSDCDIVFLAHGYLNKMTGIAEKFKNTNTLIITDDDNAIANGSCINFKVIDDKLKFEVNRSALQAHNLIISSSLLKLGIEKSI